jgi:membrane protein YdbS with pleckstrin-like domain
MRPLLIIGIIVFSVGILISVWAILLTMSLASHADPHESYVEFGTTLVVTVLALVGCIALLRRRKGRE